MSWTPVYLGYNANWFHLDLSISVKLAHFHYLPPFLKANRVSRLYSHHELGLRSLVYFKKLRRAIVKLTRSHDRLLTLEIRYGPPKRRYMTREKEFFFGTESDTEKLDMS